MVPSNPTLSLREDLDFGNGGAGEVPGAGGDRGALALSQESEGEGAIMLPPGSGIDRTPSIP